MYPIIFSCANQLIQSYSDFSTLINVNALIISLTWKSAAWQQEHTANAPTWSLKEVPPCPVPCTPCPVPPHPIGSDIWWLDLELQGMGPPSEVTSGGWIWNYRGWPPIRSDIWWLDMELQGTPPIRSEIWWLDHELQGMGPLWTDRQSKNITFPHYRVWSVIICTHMWTWTITIIKQNANFTFVF